MAEPSEIEKLTTIYESNSNNFRNVFAIMVGIGLFFLLTVILPYFLNIYEYSQNKIKIHNENETVQQQNNQIHNLTLTITNTKNGIKNLSTNINTTKLMMNTQIKKV